MITEMSKDPKYLPASRAGKCSKFTGPTEYLPARLFVECRFLRAILAKAVEFGRAPKVRAKNYGKVILKALDMSVD